MKISQRLLNHRENSFDLLRFVAASMVIFSHSYPLSGQTTGDPLGAASQYADFGSTAVAIFFVMSGFLIGRSWIEKPRLLMFAWNRFLRIFPGFLCAIAFAIFIIGPINTTHSVGSYFKNSKTLEYAKGITMFPLGFDLPGVFGKNPYPSTVNGSLWTLPIEVLMYVSVVILGFLGLYKKKWFPAIFTIGIVAFYLVIAPHSSFFSSTLVNAFLRFAGYFFIGLSLYFYRDRIVLDKRIVALLFVLWIASFGSKFLYVMNYLAIPYIVIFIGLHKIKTLNFVTKYGDYSYGMYIYAFPIQQTLMHFYAGKLNVLTFFILAYILTLSVGILSWHLVERRAMQYKRVILFLYENKLISSWKNFLINLIPKRIF